MTSYVPENLYIMKTVWQISLGSHSHDTRIEFISIFAAPRDYSIYMYLRHIVTGVNSAAIWVDSAVLSLRVLHEIPGLGFDEVLTFVLHKRTHVETTV